MCTAGTASSVLPGLNGNLTDNTSDKVKRSIKKSFFVFHPILMKLGKVVVHSGREDTRGSAGSARALPKFWPALHSSNSSFGNKKFE